MKLLTGELPPQQGSQRDAIGIADARGDLVDALAARLQQVHRAFHPQALEVGQRRLAQHRLHTTRERPLARRDGFRGVLQGEPLRKPGASPSLEAFHQRIVVNQMIGQDVRRL